jgi:hypothetical protein
MITVCSHCRYFLFARRDYGEPGEIRDLPDIAGYGLVIQYPPVSSIPGDTGLPFFGISAIMASVVIIRPAIEAAAIVIQPGDK